MFVCSPLVSSRRALSTCLCLVNIFVMSLFVCIAPRKRLWRRRTRSLIQSFVWWTKLQRLMGCLWAGKCLCLSVLSLLHLRENPPRRYFVFAPCNDSSRSPSTKGVVEQPLPDRYCFPQPLTFYLQTTVYTHSLPVTALAPAPPPPPPVYLNLPCSVKVFVALQKVLVASTQSFVWWTESWEVPSFW